MDERYEGAPSYDGTPRERIRSIYYLKEGVSLHRYLQVMRRYGITPIRYLSQLGMIIGESTVRGDNFYVDSHPDIYYAEPDLRITITEPYVGEIAAPVNHLSWGIIRIGAPKVWHVTQGKSVRIAVVDTGIDGNHPAIRNNYCGGVNILAPASLPRDYNGHGTHVAGIIGGCSQQMGILGVAPRVSLYAVKAFNRNGNANLSDLLQAINWCIQKRMQVINMSFGMENISESLRQAIRIAHQKGIIMVAATGNQGKKGEIDYPARFPETIAVTSVSSNFHLSPFGNQGKGVDIAAPGEKIVSSWLGKNRKEMSGTSMAVPHVTGTIALMLSLNRYLNPEQIRYALIRTSSNTQPLGNIGVVNAYRSVRRIIRISKFRNYPYN